MTQTVKIYSDASTLDAAVILLRNFTHGNFEYSNAIAIYQKIGNDMAVGQSFKMSKNHLFDENERVGIVCNAAKAWVNAYRMEVAEREAHFQGLIFQRLFINGISEYESTDDLPSKAKLYSLATQYHSLFDKAQKFVYKHQFPDNIQNLFYDLIEYRHLLEVRRLE